MALPWKTCELSKTWATQSIVVTLRWASCSYTHVNLYQDSKGKESVSSGVNLKLTTKSMSWQTKWVKPWWLRSWIMWCWGRGLEGRAGSILASESVSKKISGTTWASTSASVESDKLLVLREVPAYQFFYLSEKKGQYEEIIKEWAHCSPLRSQHMNQKFMIKTYIISKFTNTTDTKRITIRW